MTLREQKQAIRAFLRTPVWTEEKLCALLAHAQDKLSMWSCCCLIGAANAPHALKGTNDLTGKHWEHYYDAGKFPRAGLAEEAFGQMGSSNFAWYRMDDGDALRRCRIRPIIRAELRRRERERSHATSAQVMPERLALDVDLTQV